MATTDIALSDAPMPDADVMAHYGITCEAVPRYHYKTWHYAKLSDAVAQAKRDAAGAPAR